MSSFYLKQSVVVPGARPFEEGDPENPLASDQYWEYHNAGYDIFSLTALMIPPLASGIVKTGIATEFPYPFVGLVLDRSGIGFKGAMRRAGVIDCGFRGEWLITLYNSGTELLIVESVLENPKAKAAAQVVFVEYHKKKSQVVPFSELAQSKRGDAGFGSSDKK